MSEPLFTSDLHLDHANVIRYCKRPWLRDGDEIKNEEGQLVWVDQHIAEERKNEMNEALIANWNKTVGQKDTVYCLGDIAFVTSEDRLRELIGRLNGHIHLIRGNHDNRKIFKKAADVFASIRELNKITWDKQKIILCHYSMRVWDCSHRGSWHLYGHSHGLLPGHGKSFDVGVDAWDYKPVTFSQVRQKMDSLDIQFDHEGRIR